ncbi:FecR domain-containing protein [Oligoflexus tunisiensis]|uniref:FecR domain-containing protein n=1 Tax=Oligoflexus tunisiensis TaxID=708132 RepID=UPI00114D15F2|nr:FecR domain-containing protein [Oligoflexus tunisiensis]
MGTILWMRFRPPDETEGIPLALLASSSGRVELKKSGAFLWKRMEDGGSIFSLDSISTGSNSSAVLQMNNGSLVLVPGDTQLKILAQKLSLGFEIVLQAGGVSVVAPKQSGKDAIALEYPIKLTTRTYSFDLSHMIGIFRIHPNLGIQADQPGSITIAGPQQSRSLIHALRDCDMKEGCAIDERIMQSPGMNDILLQNTKQPQQPQKVEPTRIAKPRPILAAKRLQRPLEPGTPPWTTAASEEMKRPDHPEISLKHTHYWVKTSLREAANLPIGIELIWRPMKRLPGWNAAFRVQSVATGRSLVFSLGLESTAITLSLKAIESILHADWGLSQALTIEFGWQSSGNQKSGPIFAPLKHNIQIQTLQFRSPVNILVNPGKWVVSRNSWLATRTKTEYLAKYWIPNPDIIPEFEGLLQGADSFHIEAAPGAHTSFDTGIIRNSQLIIMTDHASIQKIPVNFYEQFKPDLVFRGSRASYLGIGKQFDLFTALQSGQPVYYLKGENVLRIDSDFFASQDAVDRFVRQLNPYLFRHPVDILFRRPP